MKLKTIYNLLVGFLVIVMSYYFIKTVLKNRYTRNFSKLDLHRLEFRYQQPITFYFLRYFECPSALTAIEEHSITDPDKHSNLYKFYFQDFLQRIGDGIICYYPVYNMNNKKREGFIVLSAGLDGKIDNVLCPEDTLYNVDWINKLNLYNPTSYYKFGDTIKPLKPPKFKMFNYFFGKKDYLIEYIDCIEYYKFRARRDTLSLSEIVEKSEAGKIRNKIFTYTGSIIKDTTISDFTCLYFNYYGYSIENWIYDGFDSSLNNLNDTLSLIGTYVDFDDQMKVIRMRNCIPIMN